MLDSVLASLCIVVYWSFRACRVVRRQYVMRPLELLAFSRSKSSTHFHHLALFSLFSLNHRPSCCYPYPDIVYPRKRFLAIGYSKTAAPPTPSRFKSFMSSLRSGPLWGMSFVTLLKHRNSFGFAHTIDVFVFEAMCFCPLLTF